MSASYERVRSDFTIWKMPRAICTEPVQSNTCPRCGAALYSNKVMIPVTENQSAKVPGLVCRSCDIIYVKETRELTEIMRDNILARDFTLNGRELWNASVEERKRQKAEARRKRQTERRARTQSLLAERKHRLGAVPSAIVMVVAKICGQEKEYIITGKETDPERGILSYKSPEGLELLSAAFAAQRDKKGLLHQGNFEAVAVVFPQEAANGVSKCMLPWQFRIRTDGGYCSSIKNRNYELVDLLVYSPRSRRFELMAATHDKRENLCYTDISLFRNFIHTYGNPQMPMDFELPSYASHYGIRYDRDCYFDLRSESVLRAYGYTVAEANGLSSGQRREILAEIVDLQILTVHQIVSHLDFFCQLHSANRYQFARNKWREDKSYIEKYRVNPDRFLVLE